MRTEILGLVAHDLRAPLGVIQSLAHLASIGWSELSDESKRDHLNRISDRALAMGALVEDLADVVRAEAGQLEMDRVPFGVPAVVQAAIGDVVAPPDALRIATTVETDRQALGDPRRTRQIVANLLSNAIKFSPAGTPVEVAIEQVGDEIQVSVSDVGEGIAKHQQTRVFQRFDRLDTNTAVPGSGVGLYIAKSLVEAQGGQIEVESMPGEGATFRFGLPAAP
jgi:signal transduction histidine kinase